MLCSDRIFFQSWHLSDSVMVGTTRALLISNVLDKSEFERRNETFCDLGQSVSTLAIPFRLKLHTGPSRFNLSAALCDIRVMFDP